VSDGPVRLQTERPACAGQQLIPGPITASVPYGLTKWEEDLGSVHKPAGGETSRTGPGTLE